LSADQRGCSVDNVTDEWEILNGGYNIADKLSAADQGGCSVDNVADKRKILNGGYDVADKLSAD
jgi:hypothetical protein